MLTEVGKFLRKVRIDHDEILKDMATKLGVSVSFLSVVENERKNIPDERTYEFCCNGVPHNSTIAIGSHGCFKAKKDREFFVKGFDYVVNYLNPKVIVIYGTLHKYMLVKYKALGIIIVQFDSSFSQSRGN